MVYTYVFTKHFPNWEPFIRVLWPKFSEHEKPFMHLSENDAKIDILKLVLKFEKTSAIGKNNWYHNWCYKLKLLWKFICLKIMVFEFWFIF